jgi:hypothetical protein
MRQTEIDKISAALDRAEFALEQLRKKVDEVYRKRTSAKTRKRLWLWIWRQPNFGNSYKRSAMRFTLATQPRICDWSPMQNEERRTRIVRPRAVGGEAEIAPIVGLIAYAQRAACLR